MPTELISGKSYLKGSGKVYGNVIIKETNWDFLIKEGKKNKLICMHIISKYELKELNCELWINMNYELKWKKHMKKVLDANIFWKEMFPNISTWENIEYWNLFVIN